MSLQEPYPCERLPDAGMGQLVGHLCARPGMYIGVPSFSKVAAYIDGFNRALSGAPLLGFREWLVVRANTGNNLHWSRLVELLNPLPPGQDSAEKQEAHKIQVAGEVIEEYLVYRDSNGITKVYYDYGRWLLRKRWYQGPLRKNREKSP